MNTLQYTPPPSLRSFLVSDKFVNLVVGPVGSTKTTTGLIKIAYEAKRVAPCRDGIRRSRVCVIRNTREQLADTTIPDFLKWFPDGVAGAYLKTERKFILRFDDVEAEVLFRGLDDSNDVRRLLSLQLSFGMLDEFREINMQIFDALQGRLGRYPDKSMNGVGCCDDLGNQIDKVWGSTNPPDGDTPWEEYLVEPPKNAEVFFQPSGLAPEADWLEYLKPDFYSNLAEGKSEDWIDVYIHAKFGKSLAGKPVFRSFSRDRHVSAAIQVQSQLTDTPLLIGFDCGLNPTAVMGKVFYDGRLLIHHAITGHTGGMGALRFCREILKPLIANRFPGQRCVVIMDPAGFTRAQTDERSVADILKAEGFTVKPARTNSIVARVAAVENFLSRTVEGGKPMLVIDAENCGLLVKALAGKYRYKVKKDGDQEDTPEKSHPWSDVADALQYLCLHADNGQAFGAQALAQKREVKKSPYSWAV